MARLFSIKELERLSGVKAHTIRTWEKRFSILVPARHDNNTRQYTIDDVYAIMGVIILLDNGHKISKLATMQREEIATLVLQLKTDDARQKQVIRMLVYNMFSSNTEAFEHELDDAVLFFGVDATVEDIVMPFLERVNLISYSDTTIETHFAVTAIRRKLILGIERVVPQGNLKKSCLLFLPGGEHYDLVLLYMCYILKRMGAKVYYLGTNISLKNLRMAIQEKSPDFVCTYIATTRIFPYEDYISLLNEEGMPRRLLAAYADNSSRKAISDNMPIVYCRYNAMIDTMQNDLA